jgi:hypothetical protein
MLMMRYADTEVVDRLPLPHEVLSDLLVIL